MLKSLEFVSAHYASLIAFLLLFYLIGRCLLNKYQAPDDGGKVFLYTSTGMGVFIVVLFYISLLKIFNTTVILSIILIFLTILMIRRDLSSFFVEAKEPLFITLSKKNLYVIIPAGILLFPLLFLPLYPPVFWDEISYHLPYAKFYLENGGLDVNPYLRYPLYAHNIDLLYALSLLFYDDILAHLFHAATAILAAFGIYSLGTATANKSTATVAVLIFLSSTHVTLLMKTSYIDLGLMLFVFLTFYCISLWSIKKDMKWLTLAGFAAGIAAGSKYSGLFYIPLFVIWIAYESKKILVVLRFLLPVALFGSAWYIRNWIISGDPISPFGGSIFGYWLWNEADIILQAGDLARYGTPKDVISLIGLPWNLVVNSNMFHHEGAISPGMLASFAAILYFRQFSVFNRKLGIFVFVCILLWFFTSQVLRYLLPVFPMISLLAANVLGHLFDDVRKKSFKLFSGDKFHSRGLFQKILGSIAVILVALPMVYIDYGIIENLSDTPVPVTEQMRNDYLSRRVPAFDLLKIASKTPERNIYQMGFENSFYFSKGRMMGDWVGESRYSEISIFLSDAERTHERLKKMGARYLLVNKAHEDYFDITFEDTDEHYFKLIAEDTNGRLLLLQDINDIKSPGETRELNQEEHSEENTAPD